MSLKAKIEAIIYAAEDPITVEQISTLVKDLVIAEQAQALAVSQQPEQTSDYVQPELATEAAAENVAPETSPQAAPHESATEAPVEPPIADSAATETLENPAEASASIEATDDKASKKKPKKELSEDAKIRAYVRGIIEQLIADYDSSDRGMEIRAIAGGYRMTTRPEHHDVVRAFAKSLKTPVRLSLAALETLAVIAYKQPVTVPEISEIRGVEAGGVIGTLLERKLITTAGRKQVVGRPILYKTSKDFLMRFGLNDISELPSMEEFEKLAADQGDLFAPEAGSTAPAAPSEATAQPETPAETVVDQADGATRNAEEQQESADLQSDSAEVNDEHAESTTSNS
jgi:segregation and condensation protein B